MKVGVSLVCLGLLVHAAAFADWTALRDRRLSQSATYVQAVGRLEQAELGVRQQAALDVPYLTVGTAGPAGVTVTDGALQPVTATGELTFAEVFGADVSVGQRVTLGLGQPAELGNTSLTVRRHLFEETAAARLSAGAELVLARAAARDARQAVEQALLQEVLGAYLAVEARRAHERNLEALDRVRDATPDPEQRRAVERQILRERKSLLQRDIALLSLDPEIRRDLDALYQQATDVAEAWAANLPQAGTPAPPSPRIRAQRLTEEAARRRGGLWFLPFVANPTLTAGLDYDIADGSLGWSVGVQLSVPVLDRGERRVSAGQRRRAAELESIRLREMERSHKTAVETAWRRLAILEIDAELAALDIEDAEAKAVTERRLFEGGFATEEAAVLAEVEAVVATLQYRQVLDEVLLEKLDILFQFFDEEIDE